MDLSSRRCWARSSRMQSKKNPIRFCKSFAGDRKLAPEDKKRQRDLIQICSGPTGLRVALIRPSLTERRYRKSALGVALRFLRGLFLRLALNQRDLLDARGIGWAPGRYIGVVFESVVDKSPFVGIHRLELKRTTGNAYAVCQFSHALHDAIFAHGTVVFAIDDHFFSILVFGLQQPIEQKLDSLESLAVTPDQAAAF